MAKERVNSLLVGAPRQGKTYYGEKTLKKYAENGGCSIVYNVGRLDDFSDFISVEFLTIDEYKEMWERKNRQKLKTYELPNEVCFFRISGSEKMYHIKDFCKIFQSKCVKIERIHNSRLARNEDFLIKSFYKYLYNSVLMIDDCRTIFRTGLSAEMIGLLSRINHAGKNFAPSSDLVGIDTILTYHGFDTVNIETWQFTNLLIQFKTVYEPQTRIDNRLLEETILGNYKSLLELEKYSHIKTDIFTNKTKVFLP